MGTTTTTEIAAGFDLALTEEQELAQRTARDFAREKVLPLAREIDEKGKVPPELIAEMASLGFLGIYVPESYGGAGLDALSYALVCEEINRACASTGVVMSSHVSLVVDPLLHYGQRRAEGPFPAAARQRREARLLRAVRAGLGQRRRGDAHHRATRRRRLGAERHEELHHQRRERGCRARVRADGRERSASAASPRSSSRRARPASASGKLEHKLGIRGSDTAQLLFQDCRVPAANLLGEAGDGFKIALSTLDGGRISIAAQAVGIARACLEDALAYAKEREAFGKKIVEFQAIQWKLADMATEIDAARLLVWRAATLKDRGEDHILAAAQAKLFASDVAVRAARECVQIFGGYGYLTDFPAERHYRDAKITEIYEGTSEIMNLVIAEEILKA